MPKTKHTATAPNGQVFTRTSASRKYSHVALGRRCKETALRYANSKNNQEHDARTWDFYLTMKEGRWTCPVYDRDPAWAAKKRPGDIARGTEWIAENPDRAAYIAQQHAERVAAVEATDFSLWHDLGWASRWDLAVKNASSHAAKDSWAECIIAEAVIA